MSFSRLSEIDLARALATEPGPALEAVMRLYNAGEVALGLTARPARLRPTSWPQSPLLEIAPAEWTQLARQITRACTRGADQMRSNLDVSRVLFEEARRLGWAAVQEPMGSVSVGFGESVRYWSDVVIADGDGPFIPFFDHRRSGGLRNATVRRVVYSMQHIGVRERNPDLADARLAVVRFPVAWEQRTLTVHFHDGADLMSYEDLDAGVRTVYET